MSLFHEIILWDIKRLGVRGRISFFMPPPERSKELDRREGAKNGRLPKGNKEPQSGRRKGGMSLE